MPGSIDYTPGQTQLALNAPVVGVFLYDVSQDNGSRYFYCNLFSNTMGGRLL